VVKGGSGAKWPTGQGASGQGGRGHLVVVDPAVMVVAAVVGPTAWGRCARRASFSLREESRQAPFRGIAQNAGGGAPPAEVQNGRGGFHHQREPEFHCEAIHP
jgi:hypothetical protein